ncbi:MAG: M48 family metalloprotease [Thermoleophilia bacterium]|nr:M48 family metalloprotease [Thermoleophilia bacterium]
MTLQQQIRSNRWRTLLLFVLFAVLIAVILGAVSLVADVSLLIVVGIGLIIYGVVMWFASGSMVASLAGAHPITRQEHPELWQAVEAAAVGAGLPKTPDVYIIDDPAPNAFAAGRDPKHAYVAATTGLLQVMGPRELKAVMAHEIAHVRNRDVRLMSLAAVLAGVLLILSDILLRVLVFGGGRNNNNPLALVGVIVALILAPIGAAMIQMALSRRREYLADASAAEITGDPEGMARALAVLEADTRQVSHIGRATAHLYIESPLVKGRGLFGSLGGLFQTHPPLDDRIAALETSGGFTLDRSFLSAVPVQ